MLSKNVASVARRSLDRATSTNLHCPLANVRLSVRSSQALHPTLVYQSRLRLSNMTSASHQAAVLAKAGERLSVESRSTPTPGPNEVLIEVKSLALNPVDAYQRDRGFLIKSYPYVLASDVAGAIAAVGSGVPDLPFLKPGARVVAFASAIYNGKPDYGGMQARVLAESTTVAPLPESWSFNEGALLPMAVGTTWAGIHTLGLPQKATHHAPADKAGVIVWGAASSVGTLAVQTFKLLKYTVYATASPQHHEMLQKLGAAKVFSYKDANAVAQVVAAARADGVIINTVYLAAGSAQDSGAVPALQQLKTRDSAIVASAPVVPQDLPKTEGVEVKFVLPLMEPDARKKYYGWVFNEWLAGKLASGEIVPSPSIRVIPGGLGAANEALDILLKGVSGEKLVLEL